MLGVRVHWGGDPCLCVDPFIREIYCWYDEPLLRQCALLIVGVFMREGATLPASVE